MTKVESFLKKYQMSVEDINESSALLNFQNEINKGLHQEYSLKECSIPMVCTYLSPDKEVQINKKVIVVDAGGTNLRTGIAYYDGNDWQIEKLNEYKMPGIDKEYSHEEFFSYIADKMKDLLDEAIDIGFCFSYQVAMNKDLDGKLVAWTKEVKAKEVVGKMVGASLLNALKKYSPIERKIVVLNDTTSVLLGGKTLDLKHNYPKYVGVIYGTGFNCCYSEDNNNIQKIHNLENGKMIINTETGNFAGFNRGLFDLELDNESSYVGNSLTEKMSSGRYLSSLIYKATLKAKEEGLLDFNDTIISYDDFNLPLVSMYLANLDHTLDKCFKNDLDKETFKEIAYNLIKRASKIVAITVSAFAIKSNVNKVGIIVEGSTFYKLPSFKDSFIHYLDQILKSRNIEYGLFDGRNRILIGAAMAVMG